MSIIFISLTGYLYLQSRLIAQNTYQQSQQEEIKKIAQSVTFTISPRNNNMNTGGSGVLINKENNNYYVITNNHVVEDITILYQIKTPEGNTYPAQIIAQNNQNSIVDDLALLKFTSTTNYQPVTLSQNENISQNQSIIASGFPFDEKGIQSTDIKHTLGKIKLILPQPLKGGYQFGYTNEIYNGMSGGAILNIQGELVGINGLGKYPAIGNPYVYQNGAEIDDFSWDKMSQMSWGIPIKSIRLFISDSQYLSP
ncbi:S1 family peptidase [Cyanobacterium stanieri]|uniref:S1 family peptidase n=1 Tax=Cyanobacterium stanieri TaxID=102235 RepID=UPI001F50A210|nr:serine protease [Cyanobacterium stanieri]